jgi:hypothetical protein
VQPTPDDTIVGQSSIEEHDWKQTGLFARDGTEPNVFRNVCWQDMLFATASIIRLNACASAGSPVHYRRVRPL